MSQTESTAVVKYQFQIDDETWQEWKRTVPRDKSLEDRIIELIEADTEGRVIESDDDDEEIRSDGSGVTTRPDPVANVDVDDPIDAVLDGWQPGTPGADRERRLASARRMLEWLREQPTGAQRAEIERAIGDELVLDSQDDFGSYWRRIGLKACKRARDAGVLELENATYSWVGDRDQRDDDEQ